MCVELGPMSDSLSLLSGDGGGGGGFICLFFSLELSSTKLSFLSVVFVVSSSTSNRLVSTSSVDVQLQLSVRGSECSVSSKAVFGRGVLLHVSVKVSGYFGWRVPLEA